MYADLLAHDQPTPTALDEAAEEGVSDPDAILAAVAERILPEGETDASSSPGASTSLASRLKSKLEAGDSQRSQESAAHADLNSQLDSRITHHKILSRLVNVITNLERVSRPSQDASLVPISILTDCEWQALVQTTVSLGSCIC